MAKVHLDGNVQPGEHGDFLLLNLLPLLSKAYDGVADMLRQRISTRAALGLINQVLEVEMVRDANNGREVVGEAGAVLVDSESPDTNTKQGHCVADEVGDDQGFWLIDIVGAKPPRSRINGGHG